jgi:hypothetical protein
MGTSPNAGDAGPSEADQLAAAIAAARRCDAPTATITNQPDGGVIFNNALTSADAGSIDRGQGVLDALAGNATAFRCCVNAWLRDHPGREEQLMLRLELAADGSVEGASVDQARSTLDDAVTRGCVTAVARDTSYPPSPEGKETIVMYPIRVATTTRGLPGPQDEGTASKPREK